MRQEDWSFRRKLVQQIEEKMKVDADLMLNGACQTLEDYKHRAGRTAAFRDVLSGIQDIIDAMTGRDDLENETVWP